MKIINFFDKKYKKNILDEYKFSNEYNCTEKIKSNNFTKLMYLIVSGNDYNTISNYLLENSHQVNMKNSKGWTALMILCANSDIYDVKLIYLLINNGANVNILNNDGHNAFMIILMSQHNLHKIRIIKYFIFSDIDVNAQDYNGWNALMISYYNFIKNNDNDNNDVDCNINVIKLIYKNSNHASQKMFYDVIKHINVEKHNYYYKISVLLICEKYKYDNFHTNYMF